MRPSTRLSAGVALLALALGLLHLILSERISSRPAEDHRRDDVEMPDLVAVKAVEREPIAEIARPFANSVGGVISPWLQESRVAVNVLNENGVPAEGIRVFLAGLATAVPEQLVTDSRGRVEFSGVISGRKAISTDRGGTILIDVVGGRDSDHDLYLPSGHSPRVRAIRTDGTGVAQASVFVSYQRDVPQGAIIVETDADGWCTLPEVEAGRLLWVEAKGYVTSYAQPVVDSGDVIIVLTERAFELCGTLTDSITGAGVCGTVTLVGYRTAGSIFRPSGTTRVMLPPPPRSVTSDAEGRFGLQVSDYAGLALRAGARGYASREVALTPQILQSRSVRIALDASGTLVGVVRTEKGAAIPRCRVRALFTDGRRSHDVETELDGHFVMRDAPLGEAWVEALGTDGYSGRTRTIIDDMAEVEIICTNEHAVVVEVLAPGRIPMPSCILGIVERHSGDGRFLRARHLGSTNDEGVLQLRADRLYDGCFIGAFVNGLDTFPIHKAEWSRERSRLELLLPRHPQVGDLRIHLTNLDSHEDIGVFLRSEQEQAFIGRGVDPDGVCEFVGLPAGTYLVLLSKENEEYSLGVRDVFDGGDPWLRLDARRLTELERSNVVDTVAR